MYGRPLKILVFFFRLNYQVKQHMAVHRPIEKPFECEVCGKIIRDRHQLLKHMEEHGQQEVGLIEVDGNLMEAYPIDIGNDIEIEQATHN